MKKIILGLIVTLFVSYNIFANNEITYNKKEIASIVNNPKMDCVVLGTETKTTTDGQGNVIIHTTTIIHCKPVE